MSNAPVSMGRGMLCERVDLPAAIIAERCCSSCERSENADAAGAGPMAPDASKVADEWTSMSLERLACGLLDDLARAAPESGGVATTDEAGESSLSRSVPGKTLSVIERADEASESMRGRFCTGLREKSSRVEMEGAFEAWEACRRKSREEPPGVQMAGDDKARLRPPNGVCEESRSKWCGTALGPCALASSTAAPASDCRLAPPLSVSSNGFVSRCLSPLGPANDGVNPRPASNDVPKSEGVKPPSMAQEDGVPAWRNLDGVSSGMEKDG